MNAGSELDALIAEKVMKLPEIHARASPVGGPYTYRKDYACSIARAVVPPYSTEITAAWEVVEKLKETFDLQIELFKGEGETHVHLITFDEDEEPDSFVTYGDTPAHAICMAALRSVDVL